MVFRYLKIAATVGVSSLLLSGCGAPPVPPEVEAEAAKPVIPTGQSQSGGKPTRQKLGPLSKSYDALLKGANITVWRLPSGRILLEGSVPRAEQVKIAQQAAEDTYKEGIINQVSVVKPGPPPRKPIKVQMVEDAAKGQLYHNNGWPITASPNGKFIATVGQNIDSVILYEIATRKAKVLQVENVRDHYNVRMSTRSLVFAPDSKTIYMGGSGWSDSSRAIGTLNQWDVATGKHLKTFAKNGTRGPQVLLSPDEKHLVAIGDKHTVRFWNLQSGKEAKRLSVPSKPSSIALSPDGRFVAVAALNDLDREARKFYTFRVWDLRTKKIAWQAESPNNSFNPVSLDWSPDGKYLAVSEIGGTVGVWNTGSRSMRYRLDYQPPTDNPYATPKSYAAQVCFSPNGKLLATGSYFGVNLWDMRTGKLVRHYKNGSNGLAFSPDSTKLLMSSAKNRMVMEKL